VVLTAACVAIALLVAADLATGSSLFDLAAESNVPTWFSQAQFLLAGLACAEVAVDGENVRLMWSLVAFVMGFFSLDEVAKIHERIEDRAGDALALLVVEPVVGLALVLALYAVARGHLKGPPLVFLALAAAALVLAEGVAAVNGDDYEALAITEEVFEMLTGTLVLVAALAVSPRRTRSHTRPA
jgi:hypothetical protein